MVAPQPYQKPEPLNPRLVTKTSLPRPKAALALALILWYVHGRSSSCDYGCARGVESEGGIINDAIVDGVKEYAESHGFDLASDVLKAKLKDFRNIFVSVQILISLMFWLSRINLRLPASSLAGLRMVSLKLMLRPSKDLFACFSFFRIRPYIARAKPEGERFIPYGEFMGLS